MNPAKLFLPRAPREIGRLRQTTAKHVYIGMHEPANRTIAIEKERGAHIFSNATGQSAEEGVAMTSSEDPCILGVIPYLLSPDCKKHLQWIEDALGGKTQAIIHKLSTDTKVMHSSAHLNEGLIYLADGESREVKDVQNIILHLEVKDAQATWKRAHAHGVTTCMDLKMQSWGSLYGQFRDPFGFVWSLSEGPVTGVTAYLTAPSGVTCESMIGWVNEVYGGQTKGTHHWPDGKIMHCEISVNGGRLFMSDGPPDRPATSDPPHQPFILHMDLGMPSQMWKRALEKGATSVIDLKVQDWGDMYGMLRDKAGFDWGLKEAQDDTQHHGVVPSFMTPDCGKHIEWIKTVLSGKVRQLFHSPEGKVGHCTMEVNKGYLYLCDALCVLKEGKSSLGEPRGVSFQLECSDPDTIWKKAMDNNATVVIPLKMQFWGELFGSFKDPLGYEWALRRPAVLAKKTDQTNETEEKGK